MIVDSSALVALLRHEDDAPLLAAVLASGDRLAVSAATYLETSIVITRELHPELDELVDTMGLDIIVFDVELARVARVAYAHYGKGSGSPARLNLGDCFAYALAKVRDEPLLFTGDDFTHTDVTPALPRG